MMMSMMMMMVNCFSGMVDRRKAFNLISSRDHCQRSSPLRISDTPRTGFEPAQNLSSGLCLWMKMCSSDNHYKTALPNLFLTSYLMCIWILKKYRYSSSTKDLFWTYTYFSLVVMSLFVCATLPPMSLFVTNFGN